MAWRRWLLWPALLLVDAYAVGALLAYGRVPAETWVDQWLLSPAAVVAAIFSPLRTGAAVDVARGWWGLHGAAVAAWLWIRVQRRPAYPRPDDSSRYGSHGTVRWATPAELRKELKAGGPGLILGKLGRRYLIHPPDKRLPHNQLVAVFGGSGSRKTRTWVIPNTLHEALQTPEQQAGLVITDPKSENYARTAAVLEHHGYEVRVLNFLDMERSDRWNPLDYVQTTTDAVDLAANIVANTINPNRPSRADPFWDMAEQNTITALVLYVKRHCPGPEQHMASVLELGTELAPEGLDRLFLALPRNDPARRFYRTFLRAEEKVRAGITAGLGARLQLWNSDEVAALTAVSDFRLERLGAAERPVALFLVIPDARTTYAPVLAIFWQQVFQVLYAEADRRGGELPRRVRCRMDELCNCGYIPDLEKRLATMRSRGVSVELIIQTVDQLKSRYPGTWSELLGNCDTWLYMGGNDLETARYISQKLGVTTVRVHGSGGSLSGPHSSTSDNFSYTGRPLLLPDECLRLPPDTAVLARKGSYPARVRKADYTEHPAAREIAVLDHHRRTPPARGPVATLDTAAVLARLDGKPRVSVAPGTDYWEEDEADASVDPVDP